MFSAGFLQIAAMLKIFIAKMTQRAKRKDFEKEAAYHFTRSFADLDEEVRIFLESPEDGPYVNMVQKICSLSDFCSYKFSLIGTVINNFHTPFTA